MSSDLSFTVGPLRPIRGVWSGNSSLCGGMCWFETPGDDESFYRVDRVPTLVHESLYEVS